MSGHFSGQGCNLRFSIVTPVYNGGDQLRRCVGSVRGQRDVSVQHLVQDGGSRDGTVEWLETQTDLEWNSAPDEGMYDAISRGWVRATGDILSWLNADEQYLPGTLANVARAFAADPGLDMVCGNVIVVDHDGNPLAARRELPLRSFYIRNTFLNVYSCTMFFRRSLYDLGRLRFDTTLRYAADMDLILSLLAGGISVRHYSDYLALFGAHVSNMSLDPAMSRETRLVQKRFRSLPGSMLRRIVQSTRWLERLCRGHYRSVHVSYAYARDEVPNYRGIDAVRLGGRFDLRRYAAKQI